MLRIKQEDIVNKNNRQSPEGLHLSRRNMGLAPVEVWAEQMGWSSDLENRWHLLQAKWSSKMGREHLLGELSPRKATVCSH